MLPNLAGQNSRISFVSPFLKKGIATRSVRHGDCLQSSLKWVRLPPASFASTDRRDYIFTCTEVAKATYLGKTSLKRFGET
jgi:hypothetical protein